jgi:hypothetical protein
MHRVSLYQTRSVKRINVYLLFINNLNIYPFKQSHKSLYASCVAESLCPTSFQCTFQAGLSVCDRSTCGQFAQNLQLRSQGRIYIGGWSKNSTSELLL